MAGVQRGVDREMYDLGRDAGRGSIQSHVKYSDIVNTLLEKY